MSESARLVPVGVSNGNTISADVTTLGSAVPVAVVLTADYTMLAPDGPFMQGFPNRPSFTGAAIPQFPHLVPSGTTLELLACEATALVNAGGGTLA